MSFIEFLNQLRMSEYKAVETKTEGTGFWVRAARATREQWEREAANKTGEIRSFANGLVIGCVILRCCQ